MYPALRVESSSGKRMYVAALTSNSCLTSDMKPRRDSPTLCFRSAASLKAVCAELKTPAERICSKQEASVREKNARYEAVGVRQ